MSRLLVQVEGLTEERFVTDLLRPHLVQRGYSVVAARILGRARQRRHRGGIISWSKARRDLLRHLKEDREQIVTTMVDYYGLPVAADGWPGKAGAAGSPSERGRAVQDAVFADVAEELGDSLRPERFIPFVVMHEFEALLFSDCASLSRVTSREATGPRLQDIRDAFSSPEEINDSPETAPSKRILTLDPSYQKVVAGTLAAHHMGLDCIRGQCPHFNSWLTKLEERASGRA